MFLNSDLNHDYLPSRAPTNIYFFIHATFLTSSLKDEHKEVVNEFYFAKEGRRSRRGKSTTLCESLRLQ